MTALLSQGSYGAVPTRPFHGEILCNSNELEWIRTSDRSEWLETSNQLSLRTPEITLKIERDYITLLYQFKILQGEY